MVEIIKAHIKSIEDDAQRRHSSIRSNCQDLYYLKQVLKMYEDEEVKKPVIKKKKEVKNVRNTIRS